MITFESELVGEPKRRVVIELPQERARAMAHAIDRGIAWADTEVEEELWALYVALTGEED